MGLFSRKPKESVVHPEVRRAVYLRADIAAVREQLTAYSAIHSPKHAAPQPLRLATSGQWVRVQLPLALHPWTFHNVAFWLLDTTGMPADGDGLVAVSGGSTTHPGYQLVRDPFVADALCGWGDDGEPWTVAVPMNHVVRGDDVPVPDQFDLPDDLTFAEAGSIEVLLEDPGKAMNPTNRADSKNREHLAEVAYDIF